MTNAIENPKPTLLKYSTLFFSLALLIFASSTFFIESTDYGMFLVLLIILLGGLYLFAYQMMKNLAYRAANEHRMARLFSAAARHQSEFYMVVRDAQHIEHSDAKFATLFPAAAAKISEGLRAVLESLQLPTEAQRTLFYAIENHKSGFVKETLTGESKGSYILSYDVLDTEGDYGVLRARPFIERESGLTRSVAAPTVKASAKSKPISVSASDLANLPLEPFISNSPLAAACLDSDGKIISSNISFRELTQTTKRPSGWQFTEAVSEEHHAEIIRRLDTLSTKHTETTPIDVNLSTEKDRSALLYFSHFEQKDGAPQILLHLIDTTDQKNLEVKYAHSQKMQAVGQLAGGVAHDFNNLLTAMIGFCDLLLLRHPAGDQSFADIMQIKQNANRAANLVRQLLAFSRRQTLQPKMLELTDVVAELSNLIRRLIGESIDLKMVHGRDIGQVKADQGQLEQVFINLAVNARDAMGDGGMLTVTTSTVEIKNSSKDLDPKLIAPPEEEPIQPGSYVLVEFTDTGCGIPADGIQKIFEPFFSTKEVGAGTGLGLATVYGIVKQTGGYVYVDSQENVGTRFCLYFPRYESKTGEVAAIAPTEIEKPTDLTGDSTILLVEDEEPVRNFAARALRNKGYTVLEADCGEMALEVIAEHGDTLDVIVSDVIMPGMNGPEMIKKIVPDHPNVKIIFISGYAEDAFTDSFGSDYEFNFLPKPFTLKQLAAKIKEVEGS